MSGLVKGEYLFCGMIGYHRSAVVKDGMFGFEGQVSEPFYGYISIEKKDGEWGGKAFSLFVENSDIRINGGKICLKYESQDHSRKTCIIFR